MVNILSEAVERPINGLPGPRPALDRAQLSAEPPLVGEHRKGDPVGDGLEGGSQAVIGWVGLLAFSPREGEPPRAYTPGYVPPRPAAGEPG